MRQRDGKQSKSQAHTAFHNAKFECYRVDDRKTWIFVVVLFVGWLGIRAKIDELANLYVPAALP